MDYELPPYKESWLRALERVHTGFTCHPDAEAAVPISHNDRPGAPQRPTKPIMVRLEDLQAEELVESFVTTALGNASYERVWSLTKKGEEALAAYHEYLRREDEI